MPNYWWVYHRRVRGLSVVTTTVLVQWLVPVVGVLLGTGGVVALVRCGADRRKTSADTAKVYADAAIAMVASMLEQVAALEARAAAAETRAARNLAKLDEAEDRIRRLEADVAAAAPEVPFQRPAPI